MLDLGEVAAAVEPARLRDTEALGDLPRVGHRDDPVLPPVDHQHAPAQAREGCAVRVRVHREVVLDRSEKREVGRASGAGRARRVLVLDEEADLLGIGVREAALERRGADAAGHQARKNLAGILITFRSA